MSEFLHEPEGRKGAARQALPRWSFLALGLPAALAALTYCGMAAWVVVATLCGIELKRSEWAGAEWAAAVMLSSLWLTVALVPIYSVWVLRSRWLDRRERAWWLFVVLATNMVGMAWFWLFMFRRQHGYEGRSVPADRQAALKLLGRSGLGEDEVSSAQFRVLLRYCHQMRRFRRLGWACVLAGMLGVAMTARVWPQVRELVGGFAAMGEFASAGAQEGEAMDHTNRERTEAATELIMGITLMWGGMGAMSLLAIGNGIRMVRGGRCQFLKEYLDASRSARNGSDGVASEVTPPDLNPPRPATPRSP